MKKISSSFIKSVWLQFGTDIKLLEKEFEFIKNIKKRQKYNFFGSLLIPSKQFLARFKFRPWKGVYIAEKYQNSLEDFYCFTRDLIDFYIANNITPVIETDFYSSEKLNVIATLLIDKKLVKWIFKNMNQENRYDILVIGGGISACVFVSELYKHNPNLKMAIVEAGRSLGGRCSTRNSRKFKDWRA